jgi:hypothetical protein
MGRLADQKLDGEPEVRDRLEIAFKHGAIAGEAEWAALWRAPLERSFRFSQSRPFTQAM